MDTSRVEADLSARVEQSATWLQSDPTPITNLKFRNRIWHATPVAFLNDSSRIERHGVMFEFSLDDPPRKHKVQLNVRIKPKVTIGEKGDSPPYVVIYVVNQTTGKDDAISWHHIEVPSRYSDLVGLMIKDWYRKWLNHALVSKGSKKIFSRDMRVAKKIMGSE